MNLLNPAHLKVALLCNGMDISEEAKNDLGVKFQEKIYSYSITDWVSEKVVFPSEIKLAKKVYVGFHYRKTSDFKLDFKGDKLYIFHQGIPLIEASLVGRPKYYSHKTSDGSPLQSIGVSCANHGVSFFINEYCQYFKENSECRFCTLVPTQKRFNDVLKFKRLRHIDEAMTKILEVGDRIDFIQMSGGSLYDHDREVRLYIPYIELIKKHLEKAGLHEKVPIHLTCMPPKNLDILLELKNAGLTTISFDTECTTKNYFEKYCPGKKETYGYDGMRLALKKAIDVFGKGNVFTIVIAGIEPLDVFVEGIHNLIVDGIVPTINVYHHDPLTTKMDVGEPNPEELIQSFNTIANYFDEYNIKAGLLGCAHYDIGHEFKKGFFRKVLV